MARQPSLDLISLDEHAKSSEDENQSWRCSPPSQHLPIDDVSVSFLVADQLKIMREHLDTSLNKQKDEYQKQLNDQKDDYDARLKEQDSKIEGYEAKLKEQDRKIQAYHQQAEESEEESNHNLLPQDTFSFLISSGPKNTPFWLAFIIFSLQISIFVLLAANRITQGSDNKLRIPSCADKEVLITQVLAIMISVYTQDDLRVALEQFHTGYSADLEEAFEKEKRYVTIWKWRLSYICRFLEGALSLIISFFLIIAVDNVFDLLLNFTALTFVSEFDDFAFTIAPTGYFGTHVKEESQTIAQTTYKIPEEEQEKQKQQIWSSNVILLIVTFTGMMIAWFMLKPTTGSINCLCDQIYVQFGDQAQAELGTYSGMYQKNDNHKHNRVQYVGMQFHSCEQNSKYGIFSYSNAEEAWTFSYCRDRNSCNDDDWMAKSIQTSSNSLVRSSSASPWVAKNEIQLDYFRLTCVDDEVKEYKKKQNNSTNSEQCPFEVHGTDKNTKGCSYGLYGPFCSASRPCKTIEQQPDLEGFIDPSADSDTKWSSKYILLEDYKKNISVQSYGNPVYVGDNGVNGFLDVIFFTGRRWVLHHTDTTRDVLTGHFLNGIHHEGSQYLSNVSFVSEPVQISDITSSTIMSPASLAWFHVLDEDPSSSFFVSPDVGRPVAAKLLCSYCDDKTNSCKYEGDCNTINGVCECKHGTKGSLCKDIPTANGQCNPYFNKAEFNFDGGDCCGATCQDSENHACGSGNLQNAFGADLASPGYGFPECIDPSMVSIRIEIFLSEDNGAISLVCDDIIYLDLPSDIGSNQQGNETVLVRDGVNCEFSGAVNHSIYEERINTSIELVSSNSNSSRLSVIKPCLFERLSNITEKTVLRNESTPQGKAIRWLNTDSSPFSSCERTFLQQRYILATIHHTQKKDIGWNLSSISECRWQLDYIRCNSDGFVAVLLQEKLSMPNPSEIFQLESLVEVGVYDHSLGGPIPSELGLLTNLEGLYFYSAPSAPIPSELGLLTNLDFLTLTSNKLNDTIPSELGLLTDLVHLELYFNVLSGPIPSELGLLTNLDIMELFYNALSGPIPSELGLLTNLDIMTLYNNALSGPIPSELGLLTNLDALIIANNDLTGTLPSEFCSMDLEINLYGTNVTCPNCTRNSSLLCEDKEVLFFYDDEMYFDDF